MNSIDELRKHINYALIGMEKQGCNYGSVWESLMAIKENLDKIEQEHTEAMEKERKHAKGVLFDIRNELLLIVNKIEEKLETEDE